MSEEKKINVRILISELGSNTVKSAVLSDDENLNKISFEGESINDVISNTVNSIIEVNSNSIVSVFISTPVVDAINNNVIKGVINKMEIIKKKNLDMINSSDSLIDDDTKKVLTGSVMVIDKLIDKIK